MKNLKKWFTLVELIVVITILAILGTIAFISLQGYSGDARNSKRTSDLGNINSALKTQLTQGQSFISFVTTVNGNLVSPASVGGAAVSVASGSYNAGTVNYTALPVKASDFQDPLDTKPYAIGVTTKAGGSVEISASMEQGGSRVAKLMGDYVPRTTGPAVVPTGTGTNSVKIGPADINKLKAGDVITGAGLTGASILTVSADGQTLNLSAQPTSLAAINLTASEMAGLIDGISTTGVISDGDSVDLPY